MAAKKTIVYECEACGTEVTVNSEGIPSPSPLYCCGIPLVGKKSKAVKKTEHAKTKTAEKRTMRSASARKAINVTSRKPVKKATTRAPKKK